MNNWIEIEEVGSEVYLTSNNNEALRSALQDTGIPANHYYSDKVITSAISRSEAVECISTYIASKRSIEKTETFEFPMALFW